MVIKEEHFTKHHDQKETLNAFPLRLQQWSKGSYPGLLPFSTAQCALAGNNRKGNRGKREGNSRRQRKSRSENWNF